MPAVIFFLVFSNRLDAQNQNTAKTPATQTSDLNKLGNYLGANPGANQNFMNNPDFDLISRGLLDPFMMNKQGANRPVKPDLLNPLAFDESFLLGGPASDMYNKLKEKKRYERSLKIEKYKNKKRNWAKKISYDCRKRVADTRLRIKGRFISKKVIFKSNII